MQGPQWLDQIILYPMRPEKDFGHFNKNTYKNKTQRTLYVPQLIDPRPTNAPNGLSASYKQLGYWKKIVFSHKLMN